MNIALKVEFAKISELEPADLFWYERAPAFRTGHKDDKQVTAAAWIKGAFLGTQVPGDSRVATFRKNYELRPSMSGVGIEVIHAIDAKTANFVTTDTGPALVITDGARSRANFLNLESGVTTSCGGIVVVWRAWEIVLPIPGSAGVYTLLRALPPSPPGQH